METRVTEVADGVHQLSTFVGAPVGFGHVEADECGNSTIARPVHERGSSSCRASRRS